jgi:hypothetical protein
MSSSSSYNGSSTTPWQDRLEGMRSDIFDRRRSLMLIRIMQRPAVMLKFIHQSSKSCRIVEVSQRKPRPQFFFKFLFFCFWRRITDGKTLAGGRTAWSSRVTIHGQSIQARFWYDGKNLNNAKEDAAEMALNWITGSNPSSPSTGRGW